MSFEQKIYGVQLLNQDKRAQSQSGGAFTAFAETVLQSGGVVYGVFLNDQYEAVYDRVLSVEGLDKLKGSKYIQASMNNTLKNIEIDLREKRKVFFTGTPCQVAGLLCYLKVKQAETENLVTCDLICHGTASPQIFKDYIKSVEIKTQQTITDYKFRDKAKGWHSHVATYIIGDKKMESDVFPQLFSSHVCLRESCYACQFTNYERVGDLTIGDFWGLPKYHPEMDDISGMSLVLVNSLKGDKLFSQSQQKLFVFKSSREEVSQPNLHFPSKRAKKYAEFWVDYQAKPIRYVIFKYAHGGLKGILKKSLKRLLKRA